MSYNNDDRKKEPPKEQPQLNRNTLPELVSPKMIIQSLFFFPFFFLPSLPSYPPSPPSLPPLLLLYLNKQFKIMFTFNFFKCVYFWPVPTNMMGCPVL